VSVTSGAALAITRVTDALSTAGKAVKWSGPQRAQAQCPAHDDRGPSLAITQIEGQVLVYCHAGCRTEDVLAGVGLTLGDLFDDPRGATYRYDDGRTVHRTPDKRFSQAGNKNGQSTRLYREAKIRQAVGSGEVIYFVEGEKDVHAIESLGGIATTAPMGAGNIGRCDLTPLHNARVIVIPDKPKNADDKSGYLWGRYLRAALRGKAEVTFLQAKTGKDPADHIAAGYGLDEFVTWQPSERPSWLPVDLEPVLSGTWKPPEPTVGVRDDGRGLLYPGRCHTIVAETEGGKTWLALSLCLDEMHSGNHVLYIDFEDDEGGVVGRLLTLGAQRETIRTYFHYLRPEMPLFSPEDKEDLEETILLQPTLAILDGITEAMTLHNLDPLDNKEAAQFGRLLPRRLSAAGAAVASLDHVVKDKDGRGRYAMGAVHKLNALDGAAYVLENRTPFGVGVTGRSTIRIAKDRPGQLRKNALPGADNMFWYGDLVLTSKGEDFAEVAIEPPHERDESFRPTILMERVAKALQQYGSLPSKTALEKAVTGRAQSVRDALEYLILDGYVTAKVPYKLIKPYTPPKGP